MTREQLLELLGERIAQHQIQRRQFVPPAGPIPTDAEQWHRHDAALEALTDLYRQLAG